VKKHKTTPYRVTSYNHAFFGEDGGFADIHEICTIKGQFQLTIDFDANTASFDHVDANLSESVAGGYGQSLDDLFDMTDLVGIVVSDTEIEFDTADPMPGGKVVHLDLTFVGNSAHLAGGFCETWLDGFCYTLDAAAVAVAGCIYYVDAVNGDDNNDGLTPETAFATIQKGIDSTLDGDTVIVAEGTYYENINFKGKNIVLTSTDPMDESILYNTIIDGNDANSAVTFSGTESSNCILRGFRITDGNAPAGGGICGNGTMATIENNVIADNKAVGYGIPGSCGRGGGLLDCDGLVQNNIISRNDGGGMCNCDGTIRNNVISYNSAVYGGGIWFFDDGSNPNTPTIINSIFSGNSAVYGGAINCWAGYSTPTIINCILWNDFAIYDPEISGSSLSVSFSNVQGGFSGDGNIDVDTCFVDADANDFHLKSQAGRWDTDSQSWVVDTVTSPCIDAGDPASDWTAELWPHGKRINMGAYGGTPQASMSLSIAGNIADLTNNGVVDWKDLKLLAAKWLWQEVLLAEDLNRDGIVNFIDFAVLARELADTSAAEPNITYQIDDCNRDAFELFASEQSSQTRFTVTIEGSYIHFEDTMVANCCPDELALEMTLEDDLITIYETEYTPAPCLCICDYPVAATLGPFEPGTYTLEVYEDHSGLISFIGSTIVTIGPD
jgi:hypothetical protein